MRSDPSSSLREQLIEALRARDMHVEPIGGMFNLSSGTGPRATKLNIDPSALVRRLEAEPEAAQRRLMAGYVSGVDLALSEPPRSQANQLSYEQIAGRMLPNLEVETFALGVSDALGVAPWSAPFVEDLIQVVYLDLDRGRRPLTLDQVERWGATDDRIYSAARSMLFHRTRDVELEAAEGAPGLWRVSRGDGHDAARCMVLPDVFYAELDESRFIFSIPSQDELLYAQPRPEEREEAIAALKLAAEAIHKRASYPLSLSALELLATRPMAARSARASLKIPAGA